VCECVSECSLYVCVHLLILCFIVQISRQKVRSDLVRITLGLKGHKPNLNGIRITRDVGYVIISPACAFPGNYLQGNRFSKNFLLRTLVTNLEVFILGVKIFNMSRQ
jgi:hypothetical protein